MPRIEREHDLSVLMMRLYTMQSSIFTVYAGYREKVMSLLTAKQCGLFLLATKPYSVCVNREQSAFWEQFDENMELILTTASFPQCFPICATERENGAYPLHVR